MPAIVNTISEGGSVVTDPTVSVIIPNYNYARFLPERIESVINQTFQDFEIIILDDASTDNSRDTMEAYRNHPKVSRIIFNEVNSGSPFRQWEKGLAAARGKYAWIAEADDSAHTEFLQECVAAMQSGSSMVWVGTMSELIDADGKPSPHPSVDVGVPDGRILFSEGKEYVYKKMLDRNTCYNASRMLFDIDTWRNLQSRDYQKLRYVGDWLFWGLMAMNGKTAEIRKPLNRFRFHGSSVTDEGRVEGETKRSAEDIYVKDFLARELEKEGYRIPDKFRYRMLRDLVYKADPKIVMEIEEHFPFLFTYWRRIPKAVYRLLWLKSHLF